MVDGYHLFDEYMLFDLVADPHETTNIAAAQPDVAARGIRLLNEWYANAMVTAARGRDPLLNVIAEGGPFHVRGKLGEYLKRLRATGRHSFAEALEARYDRDGTLKG